ncbi:hypothetical protein ACFH04_08625 [Streptomyces noboritoensis]|uniref:Uncharacterized protein n=1 Tax=Streptomyces noboritoensis TaxID=67337 RepID=A0ABV6TDC1_9ACTN
MSTDASSLTAQDLELLRRPLHGFLAADWVRLVIHPETVSRYMY